MEGNSSIKETLRPYMERLLGNEAAQFTAYYASRETDTPLVFPQGSREGSEGQPPLQAEPQISEGLDLEARRAKEIIRRGLAAVPERLRDIAALSVEDA